MIFVSQGRFPASGFQLQPIKNVHIAQNKNVQSLRGKLPLQRKLHISQLNKDFRELVENYIHKKIYCRGYNKNIFSNYCSDAVETDMAWKRS